MLESLTLSLSNTFSSTQWHYVERWILNYQIYVIVAGLLLVSTFRPAVPWSRQFVASLAQDAFYLVMRAVLILPIVACCIWLLERGTATYAPWMAFDVARNLPIAAQVALALLARDFLSFGSHYLMHRVRWLWFFHTIHHSQEHMTPLTTKRTHLVEDLITNILIKWLPLALLGAPVEAWWLFWAIDSAWDYMLHSNLRLPAGPLRFVLVTPQYHRIHHSKQKEYFDKNFSERFVIWDVLFGTACFELKEIPETGVPDEIFEHERSARPAAVVKTWCAQCAYPFRKIATELRDGYVPDDSDATANSTESPDLSDTKSLDDPQRVSDLDAQPALVSRTIDCR